MLCFHFAGFGATLCGCSAEFYVAMATPGGQGGGALSTRGGARRMKWALELTLGNAR